MVTRPCCAHTVEENARLEADNARLQAALSGVTGERDRARSLAAALDGETMRLEREIFTLNRRLRLYADDSVDLRDEAHT